MQRVLQLRDYAARMRAVPTLPETTLWRRLRNKQLGVWFRRQVPLIGEYIADFYCAAAKLIVEVDGSHHMQQGKRDAIRDHRLRKFGYRTLRIPAALILTGLDAAIAEIVSALHND